jgi:hypothetical protein
LSTGAQLLLPGEIEEYPPAVSPLGVEALGSSLEVIFALSLLAMIVVLPLTTFSPLWRLRRARGVERQQLKWFAYAAGSLTAVVIVALVLARFEAPDVLVGLLVLSAVLMLPIATGIAILRHNLYDIDRVISRTIVYASLTASLGGVYIAGVVALQPALDTFTRGDDLAVAGSTLAVAALFQPARSRIQHGVDRRFYRHKYDAETTLAAFSDRLRDEIDLDTLMTELHTVVQQTMQPEHISLWLRPPSRSQPPGTAA